MSSSNDRGDTPPKYEIRDPAPVPILSQKDASEAIHALKTAVVEEPRRVRAELRETNERLGVVEHDTNALRRRQAELERGHDVLDGKARALDARLGQIVGHVARRTTPAVEAHERALRAERVATEAERAARQRADEDALARAELVDAVKRHVHSVAEQNDANFAALAAQVASLKAQVEARDRKHSALSHERAAAQAQALVEQREREEKIALNAERLAGAARRQIIWRAVGACVRVMEILLLIFLLWAAAKLGIDPKALHLP